MLSPDDIRTACRKKYPTFLRALVTGEPFFPLEIRFGRPSTTAAWSTLQNEISALARADFGYRIDWSEINTRQWGRQRLPERVWFENEEDYLRLIAKIEEVRLFRVNVELTRRHCPELEGWLAPHVLRIVEHETVWPDTLQVCRYFIEHPRPQLYARELPIPVGTKLIEEHRPLLRSLLDFLLGPGHIDISSEHFETRFGLRFDEALVRVRALDPTLTERLRLPVTDMALPWSQLKQLDWEGLTVVITENKMTFLTLPQICGGLGIWGGGGAASLLETVPWLARCRIYYWGDLDVHGFHILSRLRSAHPHTRSVLMDEATLTRFEAYWKTAGTATYEQIVALSLDEQALYARLRDTGKLLEQEKIAHAYAVEALLCAIDQDQSQL
jgi:hypothetical protein